MMIIHLSYYNTPLFQNLLTQQNKQFIHFYCIKINQIFNLRKQNYNNLSKLKTIREELMGNQQGKQAKKQNPNEDNSSHPNQLNGKLPGNQNVGQENSDRRAANNINASTMSKNSNKPQISFGQMKGKAANSTINQNISREYLNTISSNPADPNTKYNHYTQEEDENEFMPMMRMQPSGQMRLRITLIQLTLQRRPRLHLKKNSAIYNSLMSWKKNERNVFTFVVRQDQNYELVIQVDMQGNSVNGKNQQWCALCPINIPFGQAVRVGQMTCINWYTRIQDEYEEQLNAQGPSVKNIDFKISEQTFEKWGQEVPKNFYDENKNQVLKKMYKQNVPQKFVQYRQLSRYFDMKNIWRATTYVEQTLNIFKVWIIEVTDHDSEDSISKQLHSDIKNREKFYTKVMFDRCFNQNNEEVQQK